MCDHWETSPVRNVKNILTEKVRELIATQDTQESVSRLADALMQVLFRLFILMLDAMTSETASDCF